MAAMGLNKGHRVPDNVSYPGTAATATSIPGFLGQDLGGVQLHPKRLARHGAKDKRAQGFIETRVETYICQEEERGAGHSLTSVRNKTFSGEKQLDQAEILISSGSQTL